MKNSFFIVLYAEKSQTWSKTAEHSLMSLTPRLMRWDDHTWILDMGFCLSYWQARLNLLTNTHSAANPPAELAQLWRSVLHDLLGQGALPTESYAAVLSHHPWQAVLLMQHMRQRRMTGFLNACSSFGSAQIFDLSWESWWLAIEGLSPHLKRREKSFLPAPFRSSCRKMKQAMQRLAIHKPSGIASAEVASIKRRYGKWMAQVWDWTFYSAQAMPQDLYSWSLASFPWESVKLPEEFLVRRHLDHTIVDWAVCMPYLQEDLNSLCSHEALSDFVRVSTLSWVVVYEDLREELIEIRFRNPYDLRKNAPEQKAAIAQAFFAFSSRSFEAFSTRGIVGWRLAVTEMLYLSTRLSCLFDDLLDQRSRDLLDIENQLQLSLERYDLACDWTPEGSFELLGTSPSQEEATADHLILGARRPLYVWDATRKSVAPEPERLEFSEEVMQKWWDCYEPTQQRKPRQYFSYHSPENQSLWIYKDHLNKWYVHGIFA